MYRGDWGRHGWWQGKFRGCGYRITLGREAVLDVLSKSDKHLSAEEIYKKIRARFPSCWFNYRL